METFEIVLALLFVATLLSRLAGIIRVPYPTLLASVGALVAFIPGLHQLRLPPGLILALFVAPVLLDAAYDSSLRDLKRSWVPLVSLVVFAVCLTTAAVAVATRLFLPDIPWAAAITLGALLAPPDAVAAIAVLQHVKPPYRIRKVLEGEGLLNDASALLIYKLAITAATAGGLSIAQAAPTLGLVLFGSLAAGWCMSRLARFLFNGIDDSSTAIVLQFVVTFGVWLLAERLGLSAIITVVTFAILQSRADTVHYPALMRVSSFATWTAVIFVLNVLAFVIIGLQIRPILAQLNDAERARYLLVSSVILLVVIVVRFCWVMLHNITARWLFSKFGKADAEKKPPPGPKSGIAIGWAGMRGIVTLAAAMALPSGFPYRDFMQLTAFVVVLGTLILQGLTLGPLMKILKLPEDRTIDDEVALARSAALRAAIATLDGHETSASKRLRAEYSQLLGRVESGEAPRSDEDAELRLRSIVSARQALHELRVDSSIGDDAFRIVEQELDWFELSTR